MVEVGALAATLVADFLLPYVRHGLGAIANKVTEQATEAVGEEAANVTRRVWDKVKDLFSTKPTQQPIFQAFEEHPTEAAPLMELKLREMLARNQGLAEELAGLVKTQAPGTNTTIANVIENSGISVIVQDSDVSGTVAGIVNLPKGGKSTETWQS